MFKMHIFYIKVFEKKFHTFQIQFSVPTFYFTKNVQNEHFYIKVFEKKFHTFQLPKGGLFVILLTL